MSSYSYPVFIRVAFLGILDSLGIPPLCFQPQGWYCRAVHPSTLKPSLSVKSALPTLLLQHTQCCPWWHKAHSPHLRSSIHCGVCYLLLPWVTARSHYISSSQPSSCCHQKTWAMHGDTYGCHSEDEWTKSRCGRTSYNAKIAPFLLSLFCQWC